MAYQFEQINPTAEEWQRIEETYDSTCFHTKQWCNYLHRIHYTPIIIAVKADGVHIGYFVGEKIWRGFTLITAPFEGIGTYTQGLCFFEEVSPEQRICIYIQLADWFVKHNIAYYLQVDDWQLRCDRTDWIPNNQFTHPLLDKYAVQYEVRPTLHVALKGKSEEELWAGCHYKSCKYSVNKARKHNLQIKIIDRFEDIRSFTQVHHDQLVEVCAHKGMKPKPSQSRQRMQALCESLFPDRVLMLEVVGPDDNGVEQVMSSGIFCIDKGECSYWTGASYQRYQKYCPNELMVWEAMRMLRDRGAGDLNFCGMASYKLKFGTIYAYVPRLIFTKYRFIYNLKTFAKHCFYDTRLFAANIIRKFRTAAK